MSNPFPTTPPQIDAFICTITPSHGPLALPPAAFVSWTTQGATSGTILTPGNTVVNIDPSNLDKGFCKLPPDPGNYTLRVVSFELLPAAVSTILVQNGI
jgi:hypothetical protein